MAATEAKLVQTTTGDWYIAFPHPNKPDSLAVDVGRNFDFAAEHTPDTLAVVKPVPPFNRFVDLRLEFIPGMIEASAFNLLIYTVVETINVMQHQEEPDPQNRLIIHTLLNLKATLGQALHQTLTMPEREETPYIEHDFIAHSLQMRLAMIGEET